MKFALQATLNKKIGRRYANAVFNSAKQANVIEDVFLDILYLTELYKKSDEFRNFILNPHIEMTPYETIFQELFENRIHPLTFTFLIFLANKKRIYLLQEIISAIGFLYHQFHGITKVDIISAHELKPQQVDIICQKLKKRWNRGIFAETLIDPDLIGGFQIRSGDKILDLSLKNQLAKYRQAVLNA